MKGLNILGKGLLRAFGAVVLSSCLLAQMAFSKEVAYDASQLWQAHQAAAFIRAAQRDNGLFAYEYDFLKGQWSSDDSLVRQAGAAYALAQHHAEFPELGSGLAARRALDALAERSVPFGTGLLISKDGAIDQARTGATALALSAAVLLGGDHSATQAWLTAILALQLPDGQFRKRPLDTEASPYFNGESWLALALSKETNLEADGLDNVLARSDREMVEHYSNAPDIGFFHWGQLAALVRYKSTGNPALVDFAAGQTEYFFARSPEPSRTGNRCYAVEGLAAAYSMLENDPRYSALSVRVANRIEAELDISGRLQIKPGQTAIDLREGARLELRELPGFTGAFLNGRHRMQSRIDFSQHCLSAFLAASKLASN